MNIFYFFQKHLDKLNDVEFISIILVGTVLGFFLMILFSIYYGYTLFIQSIKFLAVNNTRYIQGKVNIAESVINYEDVVE